MKNKILLFLGAFMVNIALCQTITHYRYWYDSNFSASSYAMPVSAVTANLNLSLTTSALSNGIHILHIQFKDNNGKWSGAISELFYKANVGNTNITGYRYWYDGNFAGAITVNFPTPVNHYNLISDFYVMPLPPGNHVITTQFLDTRGLWSVAVSDTFDRLFTCTAWTNAPAVGTIAYIAASYLCENSIINNTQDGTCNAATAIQRNELAKIVYLGLYGINNPAIPSDSFPTPFNDMQSASAANSYWYKAAKSLCYLEFGDGISPFSRDFFNFNPANPIKRKYALKVFMEAFNITPDPTGASPFGDVSTQNDMFGYINKAHQLGLVTGSSFYPNDNLTREDAFIILYRILTDVNITKPTLLTLQDNTNYFIPGNYILANLSKTPSIAHGNFSQYEKSAFALAGRGLPLEFTMGYNSFMTELPATFFEAEDGTLNNQRFNPLGTGWTHNYNNYIQKVAGYTTTINGVSVTIPTKWYIFWGDGTIHIYNPTTSQYETKGVYDNLTVVGGNEIQIKTKGQITYRFRSTYSADLFFPDYIQDRNGNKLQYYYQQPGGANTPIRISKITDVSTGRYLTFAYQTVSGKEYLQSVTESGLGRNIAFTIDANGNLETFKDAKNQTTTYLYTATGAHTSHLLTKIQLPKGNIIENEYFQRKLIATRSLDQNNTVTSASTVNWGNDYTASQGKSHSTITDAQSRQTTYQHNALGNPESITSPTTVVSNIVYGTGNDVYLPQSMSINSQSLGMSYDNKGNLLNITRNGISQSFTYTALNDIATHIDGNGNTTTYNYTSGNLTSIVRPTNGGTISIQRNSNGQATQITNPSGIITQFFYNNAYGNLTAITLPSLSLTTSATYDNASRVVGKTDATNYTTTYQYDNNDNLVLITDAITGTTTMGYDANDNHTTTTNAKNETTTLDYSFAEDWLMSEVFGGNSKTYTYNPDGTLATHIKGNGTFTYSYDIKGRLSSDGYTSYTYDNRNNIATITNTNGTLNLYYDVNDRLDYYTDYYGNTVDYGYDNNHNVTSIIYPGNKTVTYLYDALNRCYRVTDWNGNQTNYTYLTDDRLQQITYSNGTYTTYDYDLAGRNTGLHNFMANGTPINEYTYILDKSGDHTQEIANEPALNAALAALTSATTAYPAMPYNRIQSAGATNFTHDPAGNITQRGADTYTFDIYDNLLTVNGSATATFSYDGAGNRRSKTLNGTNTRYVLSILGMSQVLMETDGSNNVQNYYVYGPTGLISRIKPNGTTHYYHYDYRGSTIAMTDAAQAITHTYAYDAFGNVLAANEPVGDGNSFRYVGAQGVMYETPTLTFMRARYADLTTGRFISEDPIWATNLYVYAGGNPINGVDPSGKITSGTSGMVIGMVDALINGAAEDAYKSTIITAYAIKYMAEGKYTEANAISSIGLRYAASAQYKLMKGMALGAAGGYLGGKLVGQSALLSKFQKLLNTKIGNTILSKGGALNWLDMRYGTSQLARDYLMGRLGLDVGDRMMNSIKKSFIPDVH